MFEKCGNTINLYTALPLDVPGGTQIACPDLAAPSIWHSLNAQFRILGMLPWMRY